MLPALGAAMLLGGCASIGPPEAPSLELPKPPTDLHAARKGEKVILTWTVPARTTERQSVRYLGTTRVCRSLDSVMTKCGTPVADVPPPTDFRKKIEAGKKLTGSYTGNISDLHLDPAHASPFSTATYAVEVMNEKGRSAGLSNQVHVPIIHTPPAPQDFSARLTAQGVVLSWAGEPSSPPRPEGVHDGYRVFRREEGGRRLTLAGEKEAGMESTLSLTDQNLEWEKTYYYHAESFTVLSPPGKPEVRVDGDDTPEVRVFTHDVFPPAVPTGLQAVFSGPGQAPFIDLIWTPVSDIDLAGYNIYRHEADGQPTKLNRELIKSPAYRDTQVMAGRTYFYSVTAVDERGNESAKSEEAGEKTEIP